MSWAQWPGAQQPPVVAATPLLNPAPQVMPPGMPYSTDQWTQMQQQNWQQWAQWQQQYQQWHQQYGAEYQKSMSALATQPVVPNLGVPPPLPAETQPQPPLPQEDVPKPAPPLPGALASQPPLPQYSTQPPPNNNFSAPPPNFTPNNPPQPDWRGGDSALLDQKRPLGQADDSASKRQMINRQGWKTQPNTAQPPTLNYQSQNSANIEELSEAEKKFDKQFAEWEAQFNKWKDQNSGHPDKQQYKEYEKKWEQWRQQLLERREGMRKKRLGLTGAAKPPPTQNFNVPPPSQPQAPPPLISHSVPPPKQGLLATPMAAVQPKEALLATPSLYDKPPPDMNNEPLQFGKKNEEQPGGHEGNLGFLNTGKSDGIPGLDLVKDGDPVENFEEEQVPQKGPDLDAISKGISNILGDQKLMNILSMVSQNQNPNNDTITTSRINDVAPLRDQSNLSTEDSRNEPFVHSEAVQNFDDQTRSSFTMQPNEPDFHRGPPPQFNRGGLPGSFDNEPPFARGPMNDRFENRPFGRPNDDDFRRPPPNSRFGKGMEPPADDMANNRGPLMNSNFDRPPLGMMGRGANMDGFGGAGPGNLNRDSLRSGRMDNFGGAGPGNMNRDAVGPGRMDSFGGVGPGNLNRDSLIPGNFNRDSLGPGSMNRDSLGPGNMNRDSFGPPGGMNRGPFGSQEMPNRDKFGSGLNRDDFTSPVQGNMGRDKFGPGNDYPPNLNRDKFGLGPRDNFGGPQGPGSMDRGRFEPPGRGNMGRDNFEPGIRNKDGFGGRPPLDREFSGSDRDNFGERQFDSEFGRDMGRNSRGEDFENEEFEDINESRFESGNFGRVPPNQRPWDGPAGGRDDFSGPPPNFNNRKDDFSKMPPNIRPGEGAGFRSDKPPPGRGSFGSRDNLDDRFGPRQGNRPFSEAPLDQESGRFGNRGNLPPNKLGNKPIPSLMDQPIFMGDRGPNFRDNFDQEGDYPAPPSLLRAKGPRGMGPNNGRDGPLQRSNSLLDAPEPPQFNRDQFDDRLGEERFHEEQYGEDMPGNDIESEVPPLEPEVEDIWKPVKVIDYEHKSLKESEPEILVEPFRMFDYRHIPLRRVPFPDRPNWLSDAVRMIPEFDPPIIRPPPIERRLYEDRFEPPPRRGDDRYDIPREDDRYRYERRGYERGSPMGMDSRERGKGYEEESWSNRRTKSPLRFEPPPEGRFEREREGRGRPDRVDRGRFERDDRERDDRGGIDRERDDRGRNRSRERGDRNRGRDWEAPDEREARGKVWEEDEEDWRGGSKDFKDRGRDYKGGLVKEDNWKNRDREQEERARQWEEDDMDMDLSDNERSKERDVRHKNDRDFERENFNRKPGGQLFPLSKPEEKFNNVTPIEDLICTPGRSNRPPRIVIILRGPPGSGKTYLAKLIKDKEVENGGSAPRILSLDDYFMVEQEREVMEDGKRVKIKDMVYEFEEEMEESYRVSLMKSFKKTITDGYFPFIIVDNVNDKVKYFGEMWSFAKQNGFQVYICQLDLDVQNCTKRNIHNRTEAEIRKCVAGWENTPSHHPVLDATVLLQDEPIPVVEMEEINSPGSGNNDNEDGLEVRWADLEERKQQEKMRAIGFVVGQTNWDRMMDPTMGGSALTQTKFIENTSRRRF